MATSYILLTLVVVGTMNTTNARHLLFDYQRDLIVVSYLSQISFMNYTTDTATLIAGNFDLIGGYRDGNGSSVLFTGVRDMTPYYEKDQIVGYLVNDRGSCVRYVSATYPYTVKTVYHNCTEITSIYIQGLATGSNTSGYLYSIADRYNNSIYLLEGGKNGMTTLCLICNSSYLNSLENIVFIKNLIVNGSHVKSQDDGLWNILLIQDDNNRLSYHYNGKLFYIARVGTCCGLLSVSGLNIFFSGFNGGSYVTYYGTDAGGLTQFLYAPTSANFYYSALLPNGSLIQADRSANQGPIMPLFTFSAYNISDLAIHAGTRSFTPSSRRISTTSPTGTKVSGTFDRTTSISQSKYHSSSFTSSETTTKNKTHPRHGTENRVSSYSRSHLISVDGTLSASRSTSIQRSETVSYGSARTASGTLSRIRGKKIRTRS